MQALTAEQTNVSPPAVNYIAPNFRPTQPLNGRVVYGYPSTCPASAYSSTFYFVPSNIACPVQANFTFTSGLNVINGPGFRTKLISALSKIMGVNKFRIIGLSANATSGFVTFYVQKGSDSSANIAVAKLGQAIQSSNFLFETCGVTLTTASVCLTVSTRAI